MSELAKRLASLCWPAVLSDLEGRSGVFDGIDSDMMGEIEHGAIEAIYFAIETELERLALEDVADSKHVRRTLLATLEDGRQAEPAPKHARDCLCGRCDR
jgi:hypothetical protein